MGVRNDDTEFARLDGDTGERDRLCRFPRHRGPGTNHQTKSQQESPAIADGASTRNDASAYLRVAHIYMLISMPTGTSTILGAFQAIWLSL